MLDGLTDGHVCRVRRLRFRIDIHYFESSHERYYNKNRMVNFDLDKFDPMTWDQSQAPSVSDAVKASKAKAAKTGTGNATKASKSGKGSKAKSPKGGLADLSCET